ncbi:MAG TPA: helix-turn-helix domain-containing protein [Rubrobacteraceae bacterium]|jgi:excisionase family DNA binding protein|nr:helix-turn-helix domain-containing protein [Rubrobacteraceae bacterium]
MNAKFYTTQQAAELLGVTTQRVRELVHENKLEARREEETARLLISARSVHARLGDLPPEPPEARGSGTSTQEENRAGLWILVIIGVVTLLAAVYTFVHSASGG